MALAVFGTNVMPRFSDRSGAISDRMVLIRFPHLFRGTSSEVLDLFASLIREELSGILNWSIRGYQSLQESGTACFPESVSTQRQKAESIQAARPEELFFEECIEVEENAQEPTHNVYFRYDTWCRFRNYKPVAENQFSERILKCFPGVKKKRIRLGGGTGDRLYRRETVEMFRRFGSD